MNENQNMEMSSMKTTEINQNQNDYILEMVLELNKYINYNALNLNTLGTHCANFVSTQTQGQLIYAPPILCNLKIISFCISYLIHSNFV